MAHVDKEVGMNERLLRLDGRAARQPAEPHSAGPPSVQKRLDTAVRVAQVSSTATPLPH